MLERQQDINQLLPVARLLHIRDLTAPTRADGTRSAGAVRTMQLELLYSLDLLPAD